MISERLYISVHIVYLIYNAILPETSLVNMFKIILLLWLFASSNLVFSEFIYEGLSASYEPDWWQTGIIYQIYVRSFKDSNGDGIGDLNG